MDEILLIDKPAGMTSFGVVARVRRKLTEMARQEWDAKYGYLTEEERKYVPARPKKVKVGHAGTLDPFATGLLILLVGKGTKRANEFLKLDKEYIATVRLGEVSTTGDPEGEVVASTEVDLTDERFRDKIPERVVTEKPNKEVVEKCVENFVGENWQTVPAFSAVKINGQRAYKLAREGKQVEMPVRKVGVYDLEVLDYAWPEVRIRTKVSSGTYIRALGEEMGERLGTGAYVEELRRTQVGEWKVEDAVEWNSAV